LKLLGAEIPVVDLLGEPVLDRRLRLVEQRELAVSHLGEVLGHDLCDGLRLGFEVAADPGAFGSGEKGIEPRLTRGQRAVVEVGCVIQMPGGTVRRDLDEEQALGDDTAASAPRDTSVLDGMLKKEQYAWRNARVPLIDQHGATAEQVAVALQSQIDDGIEQRVTGADEGCCWLALRRHQ